MSIENETHGAATPFSMAAWDEEDAIVTYKGLQVGGAVSPREAVRILDWLLTSWWEIRKQFDQEIEAARKEAAEKSWEALAKDSARYAIGLDAEFPDFNTYWHSQANGEVKK